jgi:hypothetical protein
MSILLAPSSHPHLLRMATAYAIYACLLLPRVVWGQTIPDFDFRSFDGTDRQDKSGRAHSPLIRWAPASQVDMFDEGRPNPRAVTNVVVRMPEEMPVNQRHMKNMLVSGDNGCGDFICFSLLPTIPFIYDASSN